MSNNNVSKALGWKLLERFGVQGVQFVLQIVLARILSPEHYGSLSIMIIFVNLATVFVQSGFSTALIQKKDADERDFSSVFWVSLGVAGILYVGIFFLSPVIANAYEAPEIIAPFRVIALMLFPGAINSVQLAKVRREMNFKKVFFSNILGILVAGVSGIVIALNGGGLWALVVQTLANLVVTCLVMLITVRWLPKLIIDFKRVGTLLKFGWKLLVSNLIDVSYQDVRSLVVGAKYDTKTLGYYNRGKQFPHFVINAINGSVQAVMLPALSKEQDDKKKLKALMRNSIVVSSYIIFPMMAGLAAVATPLITVLLTEKWLLAVPYMMIYCFSLAFTPVHSCNLQAINAVGRSDIFLKLEIIKKTIGISSLVIAVFCFDSPIAIAATGIITTLISCFINAFPNKKLINYSYLEQMKDILPSLLLAGAMFGATYAISFIAMNSFLMLAIQIVTGVMVYVLGSAIFRLKGFVFCKTMLISFLKKRKKKNTIESDNGTIEISKDSLLQFLKKVDSDFPVPLSEKQDLNAFADKLIKNATICYEMNDEEIVGLVAGYTNNEEKESAYISIVAVLDKARGKGIGKKLVSDFIQTAQNKGFKSVNLYTSTNNEVAIKMYDSLGFVKYEKEDEPRPMDLHLIYYIKEK
ncbi:MAG: GNAT family N-acetyltransferase [Clostridia bacterium]|nr:GNAT family N-acetyltransferase [Clostridia bacterium]